VISSHQEILPTREVMPDISIDQHYVIELGGRRFEIIATPGGESRSALIVWLPRSGSRLWATCLVPCLAITLTSTPCAAISPLGIAIHRLDQEGTGRSSLRLVLTGHESFAARSTFAREITRIADAVQWVTRRTLEA